MLPNSAVTLQLHVNAGQFGSGCISLVKQSLLALPALGWLALFSCASVPFLNNPDLNDGLPRGLDSFADLCFGWGGGGKVIAHLENVGRDLCRLRLFRILTSASTK